MYSHVIIFPTKANTSWLDGWEYRRSHVLFNATGAGANYSIKFDIQIGNISEITDNGALEWFQKPEAVYYSGSYNRTYFGWVTDDNPCEVQVRYYDHNEGGFSQIATLHTYSGRDDHGPPSLLVIPSGINQGKLLVFYSYHHTPLYCRRSTNAEDISSWESEVTMDAGQCSYPKPVGLQNGTIIVYYRKPAGSGYNSESYRTTNNDGDTWSNATMIVDMGSGTSPYTFVASADNGSNTEIHLAWSVWNYSAKDRVENLYYIYSPDNGTTWKTIDGTARTAPIDASEADFVYKTPGSYGTWIWDIQLDSTYTPFITATDNNNQNCGNATWSYYNGTHWVTRLTGIYTKKIDDYGNVGDQTHYHDYQSGVIMDGDDPTHIYVAANGPNGYAEIQEWHTTNDGVTWTNVRNITSSSTKDNWRPQWIRGYQSGDSFKIWWMVNNYYTHYTNYDTFLKGYPQNTEGRTLVIDSGKIQDDFSDIRFTDKFKDQLLDYFIEEKIDGKSATIWVKIEDDLSSLNQEIYVYYGNELSSASNGGNTFPIFYDGFDSSLEATKWDTKQGSISTSSGYLELLGTSDTRGLIQSTTDIDKGAQIYVKARWNSSTSQNSQHFCTMRETDNWNYLIAILGASSSSPNQAVCTSNNSGSETSTNVTLSSVTTFHTYSASWVDGKANFYQDGTLLTSHTATVPTVANMRIVFYEGSSTHTIYVDRVFVRKLVDPEPTHGSWHTEEEGETPAQIYADNNSSDVDSSGDKGLHSNFPAQRAYDYVYDVLTEEDVNFIGNYRMQIKFNNTAINENLTDFPIPVVLNSSYSDFWNHVNNDGSDISFIDSDENTELYFELEHWNKTSNNMVAWVRVPQIDAGPNEDSIWVYYGARANNTGFDEYCDSTHVWTNGFVAVWHLNEISGTHKDATPNSHTANVHGVSQDESGRIDGCDKWDNIENFLSVSDSSKLELKSTDWTIEAWVYLESRDTSHVDSIIGKGQTSQSKGWWLGLTGSQEDDPDGRLRLMDGGANGNINWYSSMAVAMNQWVLCTVTWQDSDNTINMYINGTDAGHGSGLDGDANNDIIDSPGLDVFIGIDPRDNFGYCLDGKLDEVRISNVKRSVEWIEASYQYMKDQSKLIWGPEEQTESLPSNYELDLEIQWTDANYTRLNEELCIRTGALGLESIEVYVWNSTSLSWQFLLNDLNAHSWNNVSVADYLTSTNLTVRFLGNNDSADTIKDSWEIDCALLHTWETPTLGMIPINIVCRKYCENFTIMINTNVSNLEGFEFEIHYNATLLGYTGVTWNTWGSGAITVDNGAGNLTGSTTGQLKTGNLTLATLEFHVDYYHRWKNLPGWTNNLIGGIYIQRANFSYPDAPDLYYEREGTNGIEVGPDIAYTFKPIMGDVDNNGEVDVFDLRTVVAHYEQANDTYNLAGDPIIDIFDLVVVAVNFGFTYDP